LTRLNSLKKEGATMPKIRQEGGDEND